VVSKIKRKYWPLVALTPLFVLLDQWAKVAITDRFRLGESIPIIRTYFNLTYVRNTGAAFGLLADAHPGLRIPFFLLVPAVAMVVIAFIFRRLPDKSIKVASALALVISGALGNLIDRMRLGYVVDFLDFHWHYQWHFPAFNVADVVICVGVGLLMLDLFTSHELEGGAKADASPSS
jgi:signal peptidase II